MQINNDYVVKEVLGSKVLINLSDEANAIIKLNDTSFDIYNLLSRNKTKEEILNYLIKEYDIDINTLEKDYDVLINDLINKGIIINEQ